MNIPNKPVTRKDVAERAGVSVTIVSYVLNENRYVEQAKRERVLAAVKELNYRPNTVARALKGKKNNHILFIADNISNEHFAKIVEEMDQLTYGKGYLISLLAARNEASFISQINSRFVDGIVISSTSLEYSYIQQLVASGIPVVLMMNREYPAFDRPVGRVYTGLHEGVQLCVQLLQKKGRKHLVYLDRVSAKGNFSDETDLRYHGFCHQMQESGMPITPESTLTGFSSEAELTAALQAKLLSGAPIDGIVARNDTLACVALKAIQHIGLRVPEDISVVGFDNSRLGAYLEPSLTSVALNRKAIASEIVAMLEQMIAGEEPHTAILHPSLILRASV
ncbi:MAG: LacI family DNA-binding transcriptional regulator [Faecalibacterium sp.]